MPRKLPPYVECWRDRHGKIRLYYRRGKGRRTPLPGKVGSDEFLAAYQEALAGNVPPARIEHPRAKRDTISGLVTSYLQSARYRKLRQTTKGGYASRLEALRTQHGHRSVSGMTRGGIVNGILLPYADRPGTALSTLKMLRILIHHAIDDIGWIRHDPSTGIERPKSQEIRSWTEAEIAQFEARWPIGTKQRLAFALLLHAGQRRSDVHRMTWADVDSTSIRVVQQKTGAKLTIHLHSNLREILTKADREHVTILNTVYGRPYSVDGFSQWIRDAITAAGLPLECRPHGLRKAAGRRLAEAGCTAHEIMAVLGHKTLAEAERYTRDANQEHLATAAVTKLESRKVNRVAQTTPDRFGEMPKKEGKSR